MSGLDIAGALAEGLKVYGGLKLAEQEKAEQQRLRREERLEALRQAVALRNLDRPETARVVHAPPMPGVTPGTEMVETGYDEGVVNDDGTVTGRRRVTGLRPNAWAPVKETVKDLTGLRVRTRTERDLAGRERSVTEEDKLPSKVRQENRYNADGSMRQVNVDEYGNEGEQVGYRSAAAAAARRGVTPEERKAAADYEEELRRQREEIKRNNEKQKMAHERAGVARNTVLSNNLDKDGMPTPEAEERAEALYQKVLANELKRFGWKSDLEMSDPSKPSEPAMSVSAGVNIGAGPASQKPPKQEEPKDKPMSLPRGVDADEFNHVVNQAYEKYGQMDKTTGKLIDHALIAERLAKRYGMNSKELKSWLEKQ